MVGAASMIHEPPACRGQADAESRLRRLVPPALASLAALSKFRPPLECRARSFIDAFPELPCVAVVEVFGREVVFHPAAVLPRRGALNLDEQVEFKGINYRQECCSH